MRQIDGMVEQKRYEWEQEVQSIDAQLRRRNDENAKLRERLQGADQEVLK